MRLKPASAGHPRPIPIPIPIPIPGWGDPTTCTHHDEGRKKLSAPLDLGAGDHPHEEDDVVADVICACTKQWAGRRRASRRAGPSLQTAPRVMPFPDQPLHPVAPSCISLQHTPTHPSIHILTHPHTHTQTGRQHLSQTSTHPLACCSQVFQWTTDPRGCRCSVACPAWRPSASPSLRGPR